MPRTSVFIALALMLAATSVASGQERGNPVTGQRIVEASCLTCHGSSAGNPGAPSFASIAAMPSTTALSLGVFLRTSHPTMPNVMLAPAELDDVISYVLGLR